MTRNLFNKFVLKFSLLASVLTLWSSVSFTQVSITIHGSTESRCIASGTIDVSTVGGTPPYLYRIKTYGAPPVAYGPTNLGPTLFGIGAGRYDVQVIDDLGNTDTMSVYVPGTYEDPELSIAFIKDAEPACDPCNGEITAKLIKGRVPYKYILRSGVSAFGPILETYSNSFDTTHTFTDLCAGTYTVQIEDSCGVIKTNTGLTVAPPVAGELRYTSSNWANGIWVPYPGSCDNGSVFVGLTHPNPVYYGINAASGYSTPSTTPLVLDTALLHSSAPLSLLGGVAPYTYNLRKVEIAGWEFLNGAGHTGSPSNLGAYYPDYANAPTTTFDVSKRTVLHSITMYAFSQTGIKRIMRTYLEDNAGNRLDSADNIMRGEGIYYLGFDIPAGTGYKLRFVTMNGTSVNHVRYFSKLLPASPVSSITINSTKAAFSTTEITDKMLIADMAVYDPTVISLVESRTDKPLFQNVNRNFEYVVEGIDACGTHYDVFLMPSLDKDTIQTPFVQRSGDHCGEGIGPDRIQYLYSSGIHGLVNRGYAAHNSRTTRLIGTSRLSTSFKGTPPYRIELIEGPGILPGPIYRHYGGTFLSGEFTAMYPGFIINPDSTYVAEIIDACGVVQTQALPPVGAPNPYTGVHSITPERDAYSCPGIRRVVLRGNNSEEQASMTITGITPGSEIISPSTGFIQTWYKPGQTIEFREGSYEVVTVGRCTGNTFRDTIHVPKREDSSFVHVFQPCGTGGGYIIPGYYIEGTPPDVDYRDWWAQVYEGEYDPTITYSASSRISQVQLNLKGFDTIVGIPPGTYTLLFTSGRATSNPNQCFGYYQFTMKSYQQPELDFLADQICNPDTVGDIFAYGKYGVAPYTYEIKEDGEPIDSFSTPQDSNRFKNFQDSVYQIRVLDYCGNSTIKTVVTGTPAKPIILASPAVCIGSKLEISTDSIEGATYTWYLDDSLLPYTGAGFTIDSASKLDSGTYKMVFSFANCPPDSATALVSPAASNIKAVVTTLKDKFCESDLAVLTAAASNGESVAGGYWTYVSGPTILPPFPGGPPAPVFTFDNPYNMEVTSTEADVNGGTENPYVMRFSYTNSDGCETNDDISFKVVRVPQSSYAGPDQSLCNSDTVVFAATAPSFWYGYWSLESGPGPITFDDSSVYNTTARGLVPGNDYQFRWTVYNDTFGQCPQYSIINVNNPLPTLPAEAGIDSLMCINRTSNDAYNFTTYATPVLPGRGSGRWTVGKRPLAYSIPNMGSTTNNGLPNSTITFYGPGRYELIWTVTNGACFIERDTMELFLAIPVAGLDLAFCIGDTNQAKMNADTVEGFIGTWSMAPTSPTMGLNFTPNGTVGADTADVSNFLADSADYILLWTIDNGAGCILKDSIDMKITFVPTIALAGNDTTVGCARQLTLRGNEPLVGEGSWRRVGGPSSAVLLDYDSAVCDVLFSDTGTYLFEWRIVNKPCEVGKDTMQVRIGSLPPSIQLTELNHPLCNGDSTGSIEFGPIVNTPPREAYEYSITSDSTGFGVDSVFENLPSGTYTGWIRPVSSPTCVNKILGNITLLKYPLIEYESVNLEAPFNCKGSSNLGSFVAKAKGGFGTITYVISGSVSGSNTTGEFNNLSAGTYSILAKDENNCTVIMFNDFNLLEINCDTIVRLLDPSDSVTVCMEPELYGGPYFVDDTAFTDGVVINTNNCFFSTTTNRLNNTSGTAGWGTAGATSTKLMNNALILFSPLAGNDRYMVGLSYFSPDDNYTTIAYAFYPNSDGNLYIYEFGSSRGIFGTYSAGDLLTVENEGDSIKYYQNGVLLRSVLEGFPGQDMVLDVAFYNTGDKFEIVKLTGTPIQPSRLATYKDSTLVQMDTCITYYSPANFDESDSAKIVICDTVFESVLCDTTWFIFNPTLRIDSADFKHVSVCDGDLTRGSISVSASMGTGVITYHLTGSFTASNTTGYFPNLLDGIYTVIVEDEAGDTDTAIRELWLPKVECDTMYRGIPSIGGIDTTCLPPMGTGGPYDIGSCDRMDGTYKGIGFSVVDSCIIYNTATAPFVFVPFTGDTVCMTVCDTIYDSTYNVSRIVCDTTIVIYYPIPDPDTIVTILGPGKPPVVVCADISQHIGNVISYDPCGFPLAGSFNRSSGNCYTYIPLVNKVDTACVVLCDDYGLCDTTVFIFIPSVTPDTIITIDTVTCVDTTEIPGSIDSIVTCDGSDLSSGGGDVTIDANGCVTTSPDFGTDLTDTTCVIVCNTVGGTVICDTTIIIIVKPPTPDTLVILTEGMPVDSCLTQDELPGSTFTYTNCQNPGNGVLNEDDDTCFKYIPINNELDTACVVICDEFGICDTTLFIYVPPVTPDTVITYDTVTCVDTTEIPGMLDSIVTCDGSDLSSGGGNVSIDANGCVTTNPDFGTGVTDTTCIIVCNTIGGFTLCDTTIIIIVKPPTPDTFVIPTGGNPVDTCITQDELPGSDFTYSSCQSPTNGGLNDYNDTCFTYVPVNNELDTTCIVICDELGFCDTTVIIYIPPVTPDTIITTDTVVCVDTTEIPGGVETITGCDGMSPTTSTGGGVATIDANGCVSLSPVFGSGITDTTCIIVCNTIAGIVICDTTIIITVKPTTPDTIIQFTNGTTTDSCITTEELLGANLTYINCGSPNYGTMSNVDSCYKYVPTTNKLDTACTVICDEFGFCDTTVFIYIPPVTPDTVITTDTVVCVDTTEIPGGVGTITGCDGMSPTTSTGGGVATIDANGCVTLSPMFGSGNTDTTCIIVCNTVMGIVICDTTIIITVKPPTPDTITQFTNGTATDSCITTEELVGTNLTYINCGSPSYGTMSNVDSCYKYVPIANKLDTVCTVICDEFGICDTTVFIYIPPVTPDTVITTDTVVCVDTTEIPGGVETITGCDGMSPTTSTGGGVATIDANGCVTLSPMFGLGNTDTTCIIVCNTIMGVEICDTTIIITVKLPTPDTITQFTNGMATDSCITTEELLGTNLTYINCGSPNYGIMSNVDSCYKYVPTLNILDTACTIICDEFGICDTTIFIYIPPAVTITPDTIVTTDTVTCVDTTEILGYQDTITGCDGNSPTTSTGGGVVTIDQATGCVTTSPDFGTGNTDTTCIIVCKTEFGIETCDTTIIIIVKPPTPDTITQFTNGMTTDSCITTDELLGTNLTYINCGSPNYGTMSNVDSCYKYVPITNELDTSCVIICDEFGVCDTTVFIYIPPVTPDTVITTDTIVCVDTTEIPGGVGTITGCDGMSPTSSAGGGLVTIDANGCVTTSPDFTNGNTDTTCIIVCNTIMGVEICDTTIIITVKPPTPDTITQLTHGMTTDTCLSTSELIGTNYTYVNCGNPVYGVLANNNDSCFTYTPITNELDTSCVIICDEYGICDTTVFIYIPPVTPDTVITTDTIVCVDTTEIPGGVGTITGCDGMSPTSSAGGGLVTIDANGCVTTSPDFTNGNTDTTCIIVCNTIMGVEICDTTIIITVKPPTPDTIIQITDGKPTDTCLSTSELIGTNYTYVNCGNPVYGVLANNNDSCFTYTPITNELDTSCVIICDEYGICDTTVFIYIPPVTPDTVITTDTIVCVDTTEIPGGVGTITGCDGMSPTSSAGGGLVTIDANGCVTTSPDFTNGNTDTTCIIVCNTIMGVETCDTTIIITVKPPTPDTITQLTHGMTTDSCITTDELVGTNLTYINCGSPNYGTMSNVGSCYKYVPITNELDTSCVIICDEYGICDTTVFIYIPPVTPDTVITTDTIVCVDTTEIPGGVGTITGCDGMSPTSSAGGGLVTIDANGCVTTSPDFTNGNTDTTCIIVCNTIMGVEICDTTIIITVKPPTPDTITQLTHGMTTDTCLSTSELIGTNYTYVNCGNPVYGVLANNNDSCFTYTPITNELDTSCVIICDEYGICDTTVFIYIPPVTPDTVITTDTIVCVDTTEIPGGVGTITGCDGMSPTSSAGGGLVTIDANGCVTTSPDFTNGNTDTTCIIVCNTIMGVEICDTTIIITVKPPTPDTIIQITDGKPTDTCLSTSELIGTNYTYVNCGNPVYGVLANNNDSCFTYTPITNELDTSCVIICDEYGICDTTVFIYVPPVTPDTIYTQDSVVCVDTAEMSAGYHTATGCDGMNPTTTSNGGAVTVDAKGCATIDPIFGSGVTDTTCIIICDTIFGICDTTIIINKRMSLPDTIYECIPRDGEANDSNMNTNDLLGSIVRTSTIQLPNHGQFTLTDDTNSSYQTSPTPRLDTVTVKIFDKYGCYDMFTFIYIPPMHPDTIKRQGGGIVSVDTTEMPDDRYTSIGTCDGMNMTSNGGTVVPMSGGRVLITPDYTTSNVDTTCVVLCDSVLPMCECDTTYIISFKPTIPDTFAILLPKGTNTADTCLSTSELFGKTYSYRRLGAPTPHGPVTTHNDTCINYVQTSTTKYLDTARVLICDECGNCDTTVIVYVPTPDPDTLFLGPVIPLSNADTCVSLESSYMTGMHIGTCDGTGTTSSGVPVAIAGLCVRYPVPPAVFTGDTTCIVVCDTILNITICDTTLIIYLPDTTPPTVICRDDTVYLDATGNVTIDTSNVAGTVYDNTLINSVWVTPTMFNCSHVGANSVMLYARDTNRNMDSCSATITVLDTIAPTAMCQNVTIVLDSMGNASITALTVDAGSFDNCAIASLTVSQTSFDCSHVGVNTVTLTVIDVNGNVSTCTSTVTVEDRIAPIVYCPADKQVILRNTMCTYIVEDFRDEVNLWDNCSTDDIRVTQSPDPGTSVPLDNTSMTVTITATDGSGNASTCTFEVEARCSKDLNIPQFISPTGSGQNDTWEIPELANYPNNTVKVFNRWGNLVFEQKGYYTGWDGSSNVDRGANMLLGENMLPEGTYFYIIDLGEGSGIEPYVGYMQIKR